VGGLSAGKPIVSNRGELRVVSYQCVTYSLIGARSATVSTVAETFLVVSVPVKQPHI
jgi:hypothetical protein